MDRYHNNKEGCTKLEIEFNDELSDRQRTHLLTKLLPYEKCKYSDVVKDGELIHIAHAPIPVIDGNLFHPKTTLYWKDKNILNKVCSSIEFNKEFDNFQDGHELFKYKYGNEEYVTIPKESFKY